MTTDRQSASLRAREMLNKPVGKVLILDTETCDLHGEVIELAIIDTAGNELYNRRFCPITDIEPGAYTVHGISLEMLTHEPRFAAEYPAIHAILAHTDHVLTYNAPFDVSYLNETCRLHEVPRFELKTAGIMRWYAQWYGEWRRGSYKWQPLTGGDHSAIGTDRVPLGRAVAHLLSSRLSTAQPAPILRH